MPKEGIMIRVLISVLFAIAIITSTCAAQAQELDRIEAMMMKHLGIEKLEPDAGIRLRSVLDSIRRADSERLQTLRAQIGRHRLGEASYHGLPKTPHPLGEIKDTRTRAFLELLIEVADQLLRHKQRCDDDFLSWFNLTMIDGLGRHYDEACEKRVMGSIPPGTWSGAYANKVARDCYEQSAIPSERERLLTDFAFIMDDILMGLLADSYTHPHCKPPDK